MKAMIINAYGDTNVFEAADIDKPQVTADHILVKVAATSVNTIDTMIRSMGKALPLPPDLPADFKGQIAKEGTLLKPDSYVGSSGEFKHVVVNQQDSEAIL